MSTTKNKTFGVMVGLPGVGKSTYRKKNITPEVRVLSTDDIIESMCAERGITYDQGFREFIEPATKLFNQQLGEALKNGEDVMVDRTNLSRKSRARLLSLVPKSYRKYAYYFPTPAGEEWRRRLDNRVGKHIPQAVLDDMSLSFVMPTIEEGFDAVFTVA
jgi:predicted kinase